jgi:hypothetical protein
MLARRVQTFASVGASVRFYRKAMFSAWRAAMVSVQTDSGTLLPPIGRPCEPKLTFGKLIASGRNQSLKRLFGCSVRESATGTAAVSQ